MDDRDTDRELLEKAAKAAGYELGPNCGQLESWSGAGLLRRNCNGTSTIWNPLTDHGDRYRLARNLKLAIDFRAGVVYPLGAHGQTFTPGDDQSEAYATLRAAAAMAD